MSGKSLRSGTAGGADMVVQTPQERSEQMVSLKKAGDRAYLVVQHHGAAIVLQDISCTDLRVWGSLEEQAEKLRSLIEAALTEYAAELVPSKLQATETAREGDQANNGAEIAAGSRVAPCGETPHRKHDKILYGLPCTQCGAYFDSELAGCPFCSRRHSSTDFASPMTVERESCQEPLTLQ